MDYHHAPKDGVKRLAASIECQRKDDRRNPLTRFVSSMDQLNTGIQKSPGGRETLLVGIDNRIRAQAAAGTISAVRGNIPPPTIVTR
jgi:hypothetical protein